MSKKVKELLSVKRRKLIIARYIAPIIFMILLIILMLIPCMTCYIASTETYNEMSLAGLASNTWDTVRRYLFSSEITDKNNITESFSKSVFAMTIFFFALFLIGAVTTVISSVIGLKVLFKDTQGKKLKDLQTQKSRTFFLTFIPNRAVLLILHSLMIPVLFYPFYLSDAFTSLQDRLTVTYNVLYLYIIGSVLFCGLAFLIFAAKSVEKREELDIFDKRY